LQDSFLIIAMETSEAKKNYKHILKYTSVFGGVQGLNILVGVVRNKLVALILGPDGMGLISLFNSTIKLVSDSSNLGINMSGVRSVSEAFEKGDEDALRQTIATVRAWSLVCALAGMLLCIVLSPLLNRWTFTWGDHTLHFVLLSPTIAMLAITCGELAIMKGTRQLKALAKVSIIHVVGVLLITVPIYYFYGEAGIVPSLMISALIQMLLVIGFSRYKTRIITRFNLSLLKSGLGMLKLGIAFVLAGIFGSGADFLIRTYLNNVADLSVVGLFNAGYMMTMVYAGMVFSAMETDYFPRLSAVQNDVVLQNDTVNKQIEVSLLLLSPLLVAFSVFLPIILPLLYSGKFLPALGMMQVMVMAMYLRAIKLPMAYLPLAKGDSRSYLLLEFIYDVVVVALVCLLYSRFGLTGCGIGITLTALLDFIVLSCYTNHKYGYVISSDVWRYMFLLLPFGLLAFALTFVGNQLIYWMLGVALIAVCSFVVYNIYKVKMRGGVA